MPYWISDAEGYELESFKTEKEALYHVCTLLSGQLGILDITTQISKGD